MRKFSKINENKYFTADPSIIKKYASRIIPLYITGELKAEVRLIDEWLDLNRSNVYHKNKNIVCDLEILAIKNILDSPMTATGYIQLTTDIDNKCYKLERFLRPFYIF